ncbi:hypothetical protein Ato02nite_007380 [Paractinoplanes toevensis]|uniref:NPCBM/NEW2 domain-containing protein n=1 Tax=Paractinoplanes toevensis TaxID=571911 RepID=A0A919T6U5_9ACTN|nr:hypothetical protein Ato02nite_007380 [Actinoplanes toevensis]
MFTTLLIALVGGAVLYFVYAGDRSRAVFLLAGCALVAFVLVIAAVRIALGYRRGRRLELEHNVPPSRLMRAMELRQWLILTLGVAFFALATGALTALRVVTADAATPPAAATTTPTLEPVTPEPTTPEPTTDVSPSDTADPTDTADPSDTARPSDTADPTDPADIPLDTPATKYLDTQPALDGGYDAIAVTFSAHRYPRGISFYCDTDADSRLQWNVAGYGHFTTTAGIDDETQNTFGVVVGILFYDQDGHQLVPKPVEVSVGHPKEVSLNLKGAVSLRATCSGRIAKTNKEHNTRTSFGDPILTQ